MLETITEDADMKNANWIQVGSGPVPKDTETSVVFKNPDNPPPRAAKRGNGKADKARDAKALKEQEDHAAALIKEARAEAKRQKKAATA